MKRLQIAVLTLMLISGYLSAAEMPRDNNNKIVVNLDTSEVLVNAFVAPMLFIRENVHVPWDTLDDLKAAEPKKRHAASVFRAFLPDEPVAVGAIWRITPEDGILTLLKQLHPNPQMMTGESAGAWASLCAYNAEFAKIVFRIHAQFVLEHAHVGSEDGWLTPSQFTGNSLLRVTMGKSHSSRCMFLKEQSTLMSVGHTKTSITLCIQKVLSAREWNSA